MDDFHEASTHRRPARAAQIRRVAPRRCWNAIGTRLGRRPLAPPTGHSRRGLHSTNGHMAGRRPGR